MTASRTSILEVTEDCVHAKPAGVKTDDYTYLVIITAALALALFVGIGCAAASSKKR